MLHFFPSDPRWNITQKDYYDFMDSIIKIKNGRVVDVDETLEGLKPMRRWETMDVDKRLDSITDYVDGMYTFFMIQPVPSMCNLQ